MSLNSKEKQIKAMEEEIMQQCEEALGKMTFNIVMSAGILSAGMECITGTIDLLYSVMMGIGEQSKYIPDDISKGYYATYSKSDKTVESICNVLEGMDESIKCDESTKQAIASLLNEWLILWLTHGLKKAYILGVLPKNCKLKVCGDGEEKKIFIEKCE